MLRRFIVSYLIPLPFLIGELASWLGDHRAMIWWVILVMVPYMIVWCVMMLRAHRRWQCSCLEIFWGGILPAVVLGPLTIVIIAVVKVMLVAENN
jgi:hypothetical protein